MLAQICASGSHIRENALRVLLVENDEVDARIVALTTGLMSEFALSIRRASTVAAAKQAIRE